MPTEAQRGMNGRVALEAAIAFWAAPKHPTGQSTAQHEHILDTAKIFADWLDERTHP